MHRMTETSLSELFRVFGRIGVLSFGGPAAQIALMHDTLVERQKWLSEEQYLRALSLCMLLPGPEAMQLATYAGWRLRGVIGGLIAGLLFVLPGAAIILALAIGYISFGQVPLVQAAFLGIKATVIIVVLQALLRLGQKALNGTADWGLAAFAFVALFVFGLPFPAIIAVAAVFGWLRYQGGGEAKAPGLNSAGSVQTLLIWGGLWALPVLTVWAFQHDFLLQVGLFFSRLAVVTFGGAYAVLAYMTQEVVQDYGWITTGEMIDALGLAETTPGPLILVTEFVAILAGQNVGGLGLAVVAGMMSLWVTFVPCFLWIFLAGPQLDYIAARPRLSAALQGVTAAVVGVILNLSVWFALHVLFARIGAVDHLALPLPDLKSMDLAALVLTIFAGVLLLRIRLSLPLTLAIMAALGVAVGLFEIP